MQSLREFFMSSSGLVPARQGLALGWVISALTWIAVLLGGKEAEAASCWWECHGAIPELCNDPAKPIYCNKWCRSSGGSTREVGDGCFA